MLAARETGGDVRVRIFTPATSCRSPGTRCSASAFVVAAALRARVGAAGDGAGVVPGRRSRDDGGGIAFGRMAAADPHVGAVRAARPSCSRALGVERSGLPVEAYTNGPLHVYVELASEQAVAELRPDMRALADARRRAPAASPRPARTLEDAHVRPVLGVNEDPATGSAAGPLAVHLSRHGRIAFGEEIEIRQGVEIGRPSLLLARARAPRGRSSASRSAARR